MRFHLPPKKSMWWFIVASVCLIAAGAGAINGAIVLRNRPYIYNDVEAIPANDVCLVLGTSSTVVGGYINLHFRNRLDAAIDLYRHGKVRHFLLSGDNHVKGYDEPTDMKNYLLARHIPEAAITLDYAGFRTLDSVVRAREIFGQKRLTIVTDAFHCARAVFLARSNQIDAIAFRSEEVPVNLSQKARIREVGARIRAFLDVYVLRTQPKFLGEKIAIVVRDTSASTH